MDPLIGLREVGHRVGDSGSSEVDVCDEGVEAVAVVVDAEPDHVPGGVVAVADAEDGEFGLVDRVARAPVEAERAALRVDVARSPVRKQLVVTALEVGAFNPSGKDPYVVEKVWLRFAAGGVICAEAVIARKVEQEARLIGGKLSVANNADGGVTVACSVHQEAAAGVADQTPSLVPGRSLGIEPAAA